MKRKTESERFVWDVLNEVVGAPWKPTPGAQRHGDDVPAARYPIAERGGGEPLPVQLAVRSGDSRSSRVRRDLDEEHSEESNDRDAKLTKRIA